MCQLGIKKKENGCDDFRIQTFSFGNIFVLKQRFTRYIQRMNIEYIPIQEYRKAKKFEGASSKG
jgi:hypothetical protein